MCGGVDELIAADVSYTTKSSSWSNEELVAGTNNYLKYGNVKEGKNNK